MVATIAYGFVTVKTDNEDETLSDLVTCPKAPRRFF